MKDRIKDVLRPAVNFFRAIYGWHLAHKYCSAPDTLYIEFYEDIGAAVFPLAYLDALKEQHPTARIVVLTREKFRELCGLYPQIDELILLESHPLYCLTRYLDSAPGRAYGKNRIFHFYTNNHRVKMVEWAYQNDHLFRDLTINNILYSFNFGIQPLKKLAHVDPLRVDRAKLEGLIEQYGLEQGRSVILIPDTVSGDLLPTEFWVNLTAQLQSRGLKVFTNAGKPEEVLPGTQMLFAPLAYMPALVNYAGYSIAIQTGLADFLHCCGCPCSKIRNYGRKFAEYMVFCEAKCGLKEPLHIEDLPLTEKNFFDMSKLGSDPFIFPYCYEEVYDSQEKLDALTAALLRDVAETLGEN